MIAHREIITKRKLKDIKCDNPTCKDCSNEVYLFPVCHPTAGMRAFVDKKEACLVLVCTECDTISGVIAIGDDIKVN